MVVAVFIGGLVLAVVGGDVLTVTLYVPYAAVGTFLAIRRPGNVVGGLLVLFGWAQCLGTLRVTASKEALVAGTASVPERLAASATGTLWAYAFVAFVGIAFLFPDGRLPAGAVGRLARVTLAGAVALALVITLHPTVNVLLPTGVADIPNVFSPIPALHGSIPAGVVLFPLFAIPGIVAIAWTGYRYHRAAGLERLQLRWLVAALGRGGRGPGRLGAACCAGGGAEETTVGWVVVVIGYPAVPAAIAIAVMRYRLFAIDRIISRTISWTVVTGSLAVVFAGVVVGLQLILAPVAGGSSIAVAGSTLVVFAAFQPLRRRVHRLVDRRFKRTGAHTERAVEQFAAQLRDETDLSRSAGSSWGPSTSPSSPHRRGCGFATRPTDPG